MKKQFELSHIAFHNPNVRRQWCPIREAKIDIDTKRPSLFDGVQTLDFDGHLVRNDFDLVQALRLHGEFRVKIRLARRILQSFGDAKLFLRMDDGSIISGITIPFGMFRDAVYLGYRDKQDQGVVFKFTINPVSNSVMLEIPAEPSSGEIPEFRKFER